MRRFLSTLALIASVPCLVRAAGNVNYTLANEAGLAYSTTYFANLNGLGYANVSVGKVSAQVTYSSVAFANATFTDGTQATGTITFASTNILATPATNQVTVPSTALILGAPATGQFTIVSTQPLVGQSASFTTVISSNAAIINSSATLNINSEFFFTAGGNWKGDINFSSNTAANLASAITSGTNGFFTGTVIASTGVIIACASSSTACNGYGIYTTTPAAISSGTMKGGTNPVTATMNGRKFVANTDWLVVNSTTNTARNLSTIFNASFSGVIASTDAAGIVYSSAAANGTAGNAYTMATSSSGALSVSSTNFSGGLNRALAGAVLTFNGLPYINGQQWTDASNTSTGTAVSISAFFNLLGVTKSTTNAVSSVVYASATVPGAAGNAFTLASSASGLTVNSATFLGGQDSTTVTINGKTFTAGVDYSTGSTSTDATNLATAITNSSTTINVKASAAAAVVFATSTVIGSAANYPLSTNATNYVTLSSSTLLGGTNPGTTLSTATIAVTAHGFTTGLQVLYSGSPAISGLSTGTTYFVVIVDSNDIQLAATSTGAVAGLGIVIKSSSSQTTGDVYTLAPLAFSQGQASAKWQVSNDGVNYADFSTTAGNVSVSSYTFTPVLPSTSVVQDFNFINYKWLTLKTLGPTSGGVKLSVILNTKD